MSKGYQSTSSHRQQLSQFNQTSGEVVQVVLMLIKRYVSKYIIRRIVL